MTETLESAQPEMNKEQILAGISGAQAELAGGAEDMDAVLDRILDLQVAGRAIGMTFESDKKEEPVVEQAPAEQSAQGRVITTFSYKSTDHSAGRKW